MISNFKYTLLTTFAAPLTFACFTFGFATSADAEGWRGHKFLVPAHVQQALETPWKHALEEANDSTSSACNDATPFRVWLKMTSDQIDPFTKEILEALSVFDWPTLYSIVLDNDASDEYIGVRGEYTRELVKQHRDTQRFWNVYTGDVLLQGMHGAYIADDDKMVMFIGLFFAVDAEIAQSIADIVQGIIEGGVVDVGLLSGNGPGIDVFEFPGVPGGYNNPLFTMNAFAVEHFEFAPGWVIPDKIIMGEGLLDGLAAIGLRDNAPNYVHAHEFGHQVQFEIGAFTGAEGSVPEATRRTELMADGFGAYYCAHARGASFQAKRFADVLSAAYDLGRCDSTLPNWHGTPNQREAAAQWGVDLANAKGKNGHVKTALEMLGLFEIALPTLVAPAAP